MKITINVISNLSNGFSSVNPDILNVDEQDQITDSDVNVLSIVHHELIQVYIYTNILRMQCLIIGIRLFYYI